MPSMRMPLARFHNVCAIICFMAAVACLLPGTAAARVGYWNVQCSQAHDARYNLTAIDQQLQQIEPFINACGGGNWNACLQGREILFWVDMVIEQILRWNAENYCRNCLLNDLLARAGALATATRQLRAASGNQLTINADRTVDVVRGHLNDPGCCPPGTWWNNASSSCQPGATPPPNARKNCQIITGNLLFYEQCNAYIKWNIKDLVYELKIYKSTAPAPGGQFQNYRLNVNCGQLAREEEAKCEQWRTP